MEIVGAVLVSLGVGVFLGILIGARWRDEVWRDRIQRRAERSLRDHLNLPGGGAHFRL